MEIINFLKSVFDLDEVKEFILKSSKRERKPNEKYKSWVGFNYNENKLESIKLYFAFYDKLSVEFISSLFNEEQTNLYFRDYHKKNIEAITSTYEFGSGFAIGLKIDTDLNVTKAFGYNLIVEDEDVHFLSQQGIQIDDVMPHKGVYHHFMNELVYEKKYYYIKNDKIISDKLNVINIPKNIHVPILEVGFGKGFYKGSNFLDEKYILLGNYHEVIREFIMSDIVFYNLKEDFLTLKREVGVEGFCPGVYQNKKVQSFYIGFKENGIIYFDTIEKIVAKIVKD
jgi:hypothetical protein